MKLATDNGKRLGYHKTAKEAKFYGCALSTDHKEFPVSMEFCYPTVNASGDTVYPTGVLVLMNIAEAEQVHRALGTMIEMRKNQARAMGKCPYNCQDFADNDSKCLDCQVEG